MNDLIERLEVGPGSRELSDEFLLAMGLEQQAYRLDAATRAAVRFGDRRKG